MQSAIIIWLRKTLIQQTKSLRRQKNRDFYLKTNQTWIHKMLDLSNYNKRTFKASRVRAFVKCFYILLKLLAFDQAKSGDISIFIFAYMRDSFSDHPSSPYLRLLRNPYINHISRVQWTIQYRYGTGTYPITYCVNIIFFSLHVSMVSLCQSA